MVGGAVALKQHASPVPASASTDNKRKKAR